MVLVSPDQLLAWRRSLGLSQAATARILGLSLRGSQNYESGARTPPKSLGMAIMRGVILANLATRLEQPSFDPVTTAEELRGLLVDEVI